jgi:hypothetical protein
MNAVLPSRKIVPVITNEDLIVPIGYRAFYAGKTRSGKSTLAKYVIGHHIQKGIRSVISLDPKGTFELQNGLIVTTPEELADNQDKQVLIYRPNPHNSAAKDLDDYNRILRFVLMRKYTLLHVNEAYALAPDGIRYPEYVRPIWTRGAEFGITVVCESQRPCDIPRVMYSESEYTACFRLRLIDDRKRMAQYMGPKVLVPPTGHNFWYYVDMPDKQMNEPVYTCLNIGGNR